MTYRVDAKRLMVIRPTPVREPNPRYGTYEPESSERRALGSIAVAGRRPLDRHPRPFR